MKLNKSYVAYPNQTTVASQLHSNFLDPGVVIQMAIGYTQCGKTGCMVGLIDHMMTSQDTLIHTSHIYIITGLSSRDWMKQTKGRIPECMRVHVFHNGNLDTFKKEVSGKQNILVIIDEAHMASRKKQTMSRIFKELCWKLDFMMENDIKLVQFSATPDGLIFALNGPRWPERHYRIVTIQPGHGYFGAKQMHLLGNLKPTVDIYGRKKDGEWIDEATHHVCIGNFVRILRDQLSFGEPRYLVIRIRGGAQEPNYYKNLSEALSMLHDFERDRFELDESHVRRYDMNGNVDSISELLFKSPKKHTIIFVKEKMKCAQTLEHVVIDSHGKQQVYSVKHNIGVMVERRRNSELQNDSFSIQGNSNTTSVRVKGGTIALPNVNHEFEESGETGERQVDTDRDCKEYSTQEEAIAFAMTKGQKFYKRQTNQAPKELQVNGLNPTAQELKARMWGISRDNPMRMVATRDNTWCVYWRPSLIDRNDK